MKAGFFDNNSGCFSHDWSYLVESSCYCCITVSL